MRYRAALLGCGKIGCEFSEDPHAARAGVCTHAEAYATCPRTLLAAVCDPNSARRSRSARRWNVEKQYADPYLLLKEIRPDIVSVCTPDATHYDLVQAALTTEGVKAVLAEKPLALSWKEADFLVRLAWERNVLLVVNYSRRYSDSHVELRNFIATGGLGKVRLIRGLYTKGTLHNGTHWYDLVRFLVGEVVGVQAWDRLKESGPDPTFDVRLECSGGAVAELSACSPEDFTVFEMDLIGTKGRVMAKDAGSVLEYYTAVQDTGFAGYKELVLKVRKENCMRDLVLHAVEDLVGALAGNRNPRCSGIDGRKALEIGLAARQAACTDSTVVPGKHEDNG